MPINLSGSLVLTGSITATGGITMSGSIASASYALSSSYAVNSDLLDNRDSSTFANTGSNTFDGGQYLSSSFNPTGFSTTASLYTDGGLRVTKDAYISGTLYLNNVTVYGTQSVCYITSSQLNISNNLISVNTSTPSVRFGGLAVYDSGSTGLTGSILWDSENNHWVYSNPSGSSYSGGMFISGPRTSTLGFETGTTSCMLLAGQGGDHLTSSMIYHSSTTTCIPNTLIGSTVCTTMINASCIGIGTNSPTRKLTIEGSGVQGATTGASIRLDNTTSGRPAIIDFDDSQNLNFVASTDTGNIRFITGTGAGSEKVRIDASGNLMIGSISAGNAGSINVSVGCAGTTAGGLQLWAATNQTHYVQFGDGTSGGAPYAGYVAYAHATDTLSLGTATSTRATISSTGVTCFSGNVCAPSLSICGTFSTTTPLICITGTGTGAYQRVITALNPGMNAGDELMIQMGTALSYRNAGQINYHHEGAGSVSNRVSIGFYQEDDIFNVTACRYVGIGTCTPSVPLEILHSSGNALKIVSNDATTNNNAGFILANVASSTASTRRSVFVMDPTGGGATGVDYFYITSYGDGVTDINNAKSDGILKLSTNDTERLRITANGATIMYNNMAAVDGLEIYDTQTYATNTGGTINFGGKYNSSGAYSVHGRISARKENSTDGDNAAYMFFATRPNGGNATERVRISSTGVTTFKCQAIIENNVCINGSGYGLQFTGGNNRIYFGACRALEGSTSGTTLQIGEGYDKTQIQSSAQMYNGSAGNSPKLYFGAEGNETAGAKAIYLETYWMVIQPHTNEGLRIRAVNSSGTQYTIAKFYGSGTFSLDQYSNGTLSVSGGVVVSSSDKCMKIDDGGIDTALSKIMCLNPRYFYWKPETCLNSCDRQLGFYAQDVSEVLGTEVANQSHNCSWGIYDRGIIAMLTKGMQEQQCTINTLKTCLGIN